MRAPGFCEAPSFPVRRPQRRPVRLPAPEAMAPEVTVDAAAQAVVAMAAAQLQLQLPRRRHLNRLST